MEANRLSQATEQQDEVIQWLSELQDILAHRRQETPDYQRRERLGQLFQVVTALLDRQQRVATETQTAGPGTAGRRWPGRRATRVEMIRRLASEQATLRRDVDALQQTGHGHRIVRDGAA